MRIIEFRYLLPLTLDEVDRGSLAAHVKVIEGLTDGEKVESLVDKWDNHDVLGHGRFTHRKYHFGNALPGFLKVIVPDTAKSVDELSWQHWNSQWMIKTRITSPYMKESMTFMIQTAVRENDDGQLDNVFGLTPDELKIREVEHIDICDAKLQPAPGAKDYKAEEDPRVFESKLTKKTKLAPGWQKELLASKQTYVTVYKLVIFNFKSRTEEFIVNYERQLYTKAHRLVYVSIDEWCHKTKKELRDRVNELALRHNEKLGVSHPAFDEYHEEDEKQLRPASARRHHHHQQHQHRQHSHRTKDEPEASPADDDDEADDNEDAATAGDAADGTKKSKRKKKKAPAAAAAAAAPAAPATE